MAFNVSESLPENMPDLHNLPDLVINRILGLLPIKAGVQATFLSRQWAISSASALNFNEYDDYKHQGIHYSDQHKLLHRKFINFLSGFLEYHKKYEKKEVLDTLRLRLSMFSCRYCTDTDRWCQDCTTIDGWLDRAINRRLKELDIRPTQRSIIKGSIVVETEKMYRLPWVAFANNNAESLTRLNLECVKISDIKSVKLQKDKKHLLPSLKTMSFLLAKFDTNALSSLLLECPSIKYLSLNNCSFRDFKCCITSSSLEFLKVKHSVELQELRVGDETNNLESFTFIADEKPYSICENVILNKSFKLKNIKIRAEGEFFPGNYHLSWVTLFCNAKFLTSLNLDGTKIEHISADAESDKCLLPSLKILIFRASWFAEKSLSSLLSQCPSVEYLSMNSCDFENFNCHISSSSLKSLEMKYCELLRIQVDDEGKNLESLTLVLPAWPNRKYENVIVNNAFNLKNIYICVDDELEELSLNGYHRTLKASINVKNLHLFNILGTMNDGFSVKGCHWAKIAVRELWFKNWFVHYSSHFPRLIGCLKEFGCCKKISLYNQHLRALIIPSHYRKEFSSPLPKVCTVEVMMPNPPTKASRDYLELMDSLQWIAPYASLKICSSETHRFALLEEEEY